MCYSALLKDRFEQFIRQTGARTDIHEFARMYGMKIIAGGMPVTRAMDRWFDDPKTMEERQLMVLVKRAREAEAKVLEGEFGELQERLALNEAKLAKKATKTAEKEIGIANRGIERITRRLAALRDGKVRETDGRFWSKYYAPIILRDPVEGLVVRPARFLLRRPQDTPERDITHKGCFNARRDSLTQVWRGQFGHTHALIPAAHFFENVKGKELRFTPDDKQDMLIACLYATWKDPEGGPDLLSFAFITDDPPPEVLAAGHDRCPVNLAESAIERWLTPQGRSTEELQALLDERQRPYYEHQVLAA
jgi:putative SOS response-associated peptidase YedK